MQTPTTLPAAWARLGYVLNWAGIVVGLLLAAFMAVVASPLGTGWEIVFAAGAFLLCYAAGRAGRYILAGR
jgi:hypothetical protein